MPLARMPRPGKARIALMPAGFSTPCSASSIVERQTLDEAQRPVGPAAMDAALALSRGEGAADMAAGRHGNQRLLGPPSVPATRSQGANRPSRIVSPSRRASS